MGKWGSSAACPLCLRSVFPMEAVYAADRTPYHKVLTNYSNIRSWQLTKEGLATSFAKFFVNSETLGLQIIDFFTVLSQMHRVWKKTRHEELERARKVALLLLLLPGMQEIQITSRISRFPCCVLSYFSLVFVMEHNWQIQVIRVSWVEQSTRWTESPPKSAQKSTRESRLFKGLSVHHNLPQGGTLRL